MAAELERRWEEALRALKQAEDAYTQQQQNPQTSLALPVELKEAFMAIGQRLPGVWHRGVLTQQNKKALLRCLIDKVVIHRLAPDRVQARIVWRGGDTTTLEIPVSTNSAARLSKAAEMEHIILDLSRQGKSDEQIAQHLTALGHRSPRQPDCVLPNTVKIIRLKHRVFQKRSQSHPRRVAGYLTLPQIASALDVTPHWIYHLIDNGRIQVAKDAQSRLYLFPDNPETLALFKQLREGAVYNLRF